MLGRQFRLLYFTFGREYLKYKEYGDISKEERRRRRKDADYSDYWQQQANVEKSTPAVLTAIATLAEDAPEITLALYVIIGHGQQETVIGQFCLLI